MLYLAAMNNRPFGTQLLLSSAIAFTGLLGLSGTVAAATPNSIEGVWSFSGGAVAIQPLSDGKYQGTVVSPTTTFASCPHPEGQVMWTDMQPQADGSFWGLHQWYRGATCEEVPTLGHTAWRVLTDSSGARVLRVCFNNPGTETQPTISPAGLDANVTYGCTDSSPLASLPETENPGGGNQGGNGSGGGTNAITFIQTVALPSAKACISQTSLKISLKDPKYDSLKEVVVKIKGKKVADVKGIKQLRKGVTLKKLPTGTYKLSVKATTVLNQHLTGSQTYHSCTKGSGKINLHHAKTKKK
jgi:hypothetical protein